MPILGKDPVMWSLKHSLEELPVIPTRRKLRRKDSYALESRLCYIWPLYVKLRRQSEVGSGPGPVSAGTAHVTSLTLRSFCLK